MRSIRKPARRSCVESARQVYGVRFSRLNLSQIKSSFIGEREILAVWRDRSTKDRCLSSVRSEPSERRKSRLHGCPLTSDPPPKYHGDNKQPGAHRQPLSVQNFGGCRGWC